MISLSPKGKTELLSGMTDKMSSAHLMVNDGELEGHDYSPIKLVRTKWIEGRYPTMTWEFTAGNIEDVLGYYIVNKEGDLIFSELFDATYTIQHSGDRISVNINFNLLGTGV